MWSTQARWEERCYMVFLTDCLQLVVNIHLDWNQKKKKNHSHLFLLKYIPNFRNILSILKLFKSSSTKNAFCTDAIGSETIVSLYA